MGSFNEYKLAINEAMKLPEIISLNNIVSFNNSLTCPRFNAIAEILTKARLDTKEILNVELINLIQYSKKQTKE